MKEFPKKYSILETEQKWQKYWEQEKIYNWDPTYSRDNTFVIDTPPPTVSGLLHMGHIFSYTQTDIIARFQRMKGKTVFYPMGFDDNGLPTERLVEKEKKIKAVSMPRSEFIELCKEVVEKSEEEFRHLFKAIALSVDWTQEYRTISDQSKKISQLSFIDLLNKNEAYRKLEPVLWDIADRTALSQADIEDIELESSMNHIEFQTEDGKKFAVATTRPELLPACVAVFYNPKDERYKYLANKTAITPLFGIKVPIIEDETVDIEKGTGIVMCCTFGDTNDVYWWKTHNLDTKIILDQSGKIIDFTEMLNLNNSTNPILANEISNKLISLKVKDARKEILEILLEHKLLLHQQVIVHAVKCAERSKAPIEILITPQWFIKVLDKKSELIEKANESIWYPPYMKDRLEIWINNLSWDWCISRQRFFGVPFPVWYSKRKGEEGKILIPNIDQLPVDPMIDLPDGYNRDEVEADCDVMDTWATSSVSPQLNSLGISDKYAIDIERHQKLFPADLRPQAHEIIRTWTFYTIVKSYIHQASIPWKNLMISGWCLAADKSKMSKSKGNVVTPLKLIEEKGADAIRYWTATSKLGADIAYSEETLGNGKRLINKLWNASQFANIHLKNMIGKPSNPKNDVANQTIYCAVDKWILAKLFHTIEKATKEFERYEFALARNVIENFFWQDFCDNYLELSKTRAYNEQNLDQKGQQSAIYTIYHCLKTVLLMISPIIPHITEEIFSIIYAEGKSIHQIGTWPNLNDFNQNLYSHHGDICIKILDLVRKTKAEKMLSVKAPISELFIDRQLNSNNDLEDFVIDLANVTSSKKVTFSDLKEDFIQNTDGNIKIRVKFEE